jgi:hypothetical protein
MPKWFYAKYNFFYAVILKRIFLGLLPCQSYARFFQHFPSHIEKWT